MVTQQKPEEVAAKGAGLVLLTLASAQFLMTLDSSVMNVSIATVAKDGRHDGYRDPDRYHVLHACDGDPDAHRWQDWSHYRTSTRFLHRLRDLRSRVAHYCSVAKPWHPDTGMVVPGRHRRRADHARRCGPGRYQFRAATPLEHVWYDRGSRCDSRCPWATDRWGLHDVCILAIRLRRRSDYRPRDPRTVPPHPGCSIDRATPPRLCWLHPLRPWTGTGCLRSLAFECLGMDRTKARRAVDLRTIAGGVADPGWTPHPVGVVFLGAVVWRKRVRSHLFARRCSGIDNSSVD